MRHASTLLSSSDSLPWAWDTDVPAPSDEPRLGLVTLYFDSRVSTERRATLRSDVGVMVATAAARIAGLGAFGPSRVDIFFRSRVRFGSGVGGFCETDDGDERAFRIEISGAADPTGLPEVRLLLAHELGHLIIGCADRLTGRSPGHGELAVIARLLVDEYLAERAVGLLLAPHIVISGASGLERSDLLTRIGKRNITGYANLLRHQYRPIPGLISQAYRDEPGPRALAETMLALKRLASSVAYTVGAAHVFCVDRSPLSTALARLPQDVAAGLQTIEGILDAAGRDLPDEFSLSDLAAFGARADPAVEAALGDLSRHLLARMAGRMRSEVIHPGWLDSI